mgnify:CR=1 FL=1
MLSRRLIPCLDVRDGQVVKGVRFRDHVVMGAIEDLALRYRDEGADELVFYDITASPQGRGVDRAWVERVARIIDIPFCVAGGIRSVAQAREVLLAGADKISVNTPALERPELINELAAEFGVQCVVVGIDSLRDGDGEWRVRAYTGDPDQTRALPRRTLDWVAEVQQRGAGQRTTTWAPSISLQATPTVSTYLEAGFFDVSDGPDQSIAGAGLSWRVRPSVQLDVSFDVGLDDESPDLQFATGLNSCNCAPCCNAISRTMASPRPSR